MKPTSEQKVLADEATEGARRAERQYELERAKVLALASIAQSLAVISEAIAEDM